MTDFKTLLQAFDQLLQPEKFKDYGPNGLQVEGRRDIQKIVSGVTASRELIDAAIAAKADAIFVHHGLFWRGQDGRVTFGCGWTQSQRQSFTAFRPRRARRLAIYQRTLSHDHTRHWTQ
jgi:hypothetical protein